MPTIAARYNPKDPPPLRSYAGLSAAYAASIGLVAYGLRRRGGPARMRAVDVALLGIASQKLSRLITRDLVTSWIRAPFSQVEEAAGAGELNEKPRGRGLQHAVGELITCPFCFGQWVVTGLAALFAFRPREARFVAGTLTAVSVADVAQLGYGVLHKKATEATAA